MTKNTKVTVLMPAYNAALYIAEAIDSVLAQTFTDYELLIVDDGSTDGTVDIIKFYKDSRICLICQDNAGVASALNKGLDLATGKYVARFDADDICEPNRLHTQYNFLLANPQYSILGSAANYVDQFGDYVFTYVPPVVSKEIDVNSQLKICPFIHATTFYRKHDIIAAGKYNTNAHGFEDHLLWLKLLKTHKGYNLKETLIKVRLNPASVTIDEQWQSHRFIEIKNKALLTGTITNLEGEELLQIRQRQQHTQIDKQAYNSLLAKKYLWNNNNPKKARRYLSAAISASKLNLANYPLWALSLLPGWLTAKIYRLLKPYAFKS